MCAVCGWLPVQEPIVAIFGINLYRSLASLVFIKCMIYRWLTMRSQTTPNPLSVYLEAGSNKDEWLLSVFALLSKLQNEPFHPLGSCLDLCASFPWIEPADMRFKDVSPTSWAVWNTLGKGQIYAAETFGLVGALVFGIFQNRSLSSSELALRRFGSVHGTCSIIRSATDNRSCIILAFVPF